MNVVKVIESIINLGNSCLFSRRWYMFVANVTAITLLGITLSVGLINANPPKLIFKIKHHERTKLE